MTRHCIVRVVTAAALYVKGGSFALEPLASSDIPTHSDWDTFYASAHALLHHQDLYAADPSLLPNLNPPLLSVLLAPIALLDVLQGYRVWVLITAILVAASMTAVAAELRLRAAVALPVVGLALVFSPVLATLGLGQIYPLLTAGLTAAWLLHRRGRLAWEGVAIGLTIALKPSLAPLLLVPALRRQWPTAAAALFTGTGATIAAWVIAGAQSTRSGHGSCSPTAR